MIGARVKPAARCFQCFVPGRNGFRMARVPHVALLIETSRSYGRALLRGVRRYMTEHGPWSLFLELRALESDAPPWLKNWQGDGILTRTGSQAMADAIRRAHVPTVELRSTRLEHDFPFVGVDNHSLGRLVAEHLLERGFRHFGVYELGTETYFEERRDDFVQTLQSRGIVCDAYRPRGRRERPADWERAQADLAAWATGLPKPVGVMACTDQLGFWLLDACRRAELNVPEDVAVVGVENDSSLCDTATPPLSSVDVNGECVGYEAARLLDQMMNGAPKPTEPILIEPRGVVTRQSSDVVAVDQPLLAQSLRFIRAHACDGINVSDLLRAVPVSRSWLEREMRRTLGRSPNQEILRVRLQRVQQLLIETDLTLLQIADRAGFAHQQYLSAAFQREFGASPGAFRRARRV